MLPPVEEIVLQSNPEFAALYSTLSTVILNADGTTKNDPSAKERQAVRKVGRFSFRITGLTCLQMIDQVSQELDKHRLQTARQHLVAQALSTATPPEPKAPLRRAKPQLRQDTTSDLPEPLLDLLLLLPALLTSSEDLSAENTKLLLSNPPFSSLNCLLPDLAKLVSSNIQSTAVLLARISNPTTNPSFLHRSIPNIPSHVRTLSSTIEDDKVALSKARFSAANSLVDLLQKHTQALISLIRSLEAKHGGVARSLEFRAAEVALLAQRGEVDAEVALWNARKSIYTPDIVDALHNYASHLKDGQMRLGETVRTLQMELDEYGLGGVDEGKERTMREMARVYGEMGRQLDEIKEDLRRLRR